MAEFLGSNGRQGTDGERVLHLGSGMLNSLVLFGCSSVVRSL